jgi:septal ring factor EnvC (AmiA/AmiB activator)
MDKEVRVLHLPPLLPTLARCSRTGDGNDQRPTMSALKERLALSEKTLTAATATSTTLTADVARQTADVRDIELQLADIAKSERMLEGILSAYVAVLAAYAHHDDPHRRSSQDAPERVRGTAVRDGPC